jgi:hypothetical protein
VVEIRPATREDMVGFYQKNPQHSCRSWVCVEDEKIVGLFGYYISNGLLMAFCDIRGEHPKLKVWKTALRCLEELKKTGLPFIAIPNKELPRAGQFLSRLGFMRLNETSDGDVYLWHNSR